MTDHTHEASAIVRSSIWYWIDGGGAWMDRWECSSHDALLCVAVIATGLLQAVLYAQYAIQNQRALKLVKETHYRSEKQHLIKVFLLCLATHLFGRVTPWVAPLYWIEVAMCISCVWASWNLVGSKRELLAIQEVASGQMAMELVDDAKKVIRTERRKADDELLAALDRIDAALMAETLGQGHGQ